MKVKQLLKLLQNENPNHLVVLSSDAEGNTYRKLSSVCGCLVFNEDYNEIDDANNTVLKNAKDCIVLYPVD